MYGCFRLTCSNRSRSTETIMESDGCLSLKPTIAEARSIIGEHYLVDHCQPEWLHVDNMKLLKVNVGSGNCLVSGNKWSPRLQNSWGQHRAHLGPVGPRWAACWPQEPGYQGSYLPIKTLLEKVRSLTTKLHAMFARNDSPIFADVFASNYYFLQFNESMEHINSDHRYLCVKIIYLNLKWSIWYIDKKIYVYNVWSIRVLLNTLPNNFV